MAISQNLIGHIIAVLQQCLQFSRAADRVLSDYFRENRALGQSERGTIAETVYAVLRRKRYLEYLGCQTPRQFALMALNRLAGLSRRELDGLTSAEEKTWLSEAGRGGTPPFAVQADFPDWLIDALLPVTGEEELLRLARAMQNPAPLDLRVNTVRMKREAALEALTRTGIEAVETPYSPVGLRLKHKIALQHHALFLNGTLEVQDEASQLLGFLLAPQRNEKIVDFCAGAGGKTLLLGALMSSQGRLYAFDISQKRLDGFKARLKRSGLSNVQPERIDSERDPRLKRLRGKIDRVLVDAPCSGLGTLRRNPDLKWRQQPADIAEMQVKQSAILAAAAQLVKPGGRLVYATCSIVPSENQGIAEEFLARNPDFRLLNASGVLAARQIPLDTGQYFQTAPHLHGTDAFFAAVMERAPA